MVDLPEQRPADRRLLFRRGFGDGAKCSAIKHENEPDYMEGWETGRVAYNRAAHDFREKYGLPEPLILRAQTPTPEPTDA